MLSLLLYATANSEPKGAPNTRLTLYPDMTSHQLRQPQAYGQPKARSPIFFCRREVSLLEGSEDPLLMLGANADPLVFHFKTKKQFSARQRLLY